MKSKKNVLFLLSVLVLLLIPGLTGCRLGRATPTPIAINLPGQSTTTTTDVTYTVQKGEVVQESLFSGRVIPARQEDLFFRRSGQVTQVFVSDGDLVQSGDVIAALDNEVLELDLESALLGLAIAKESLTKAQKDLAYRRQQAELNLRIAEINLENSTAPDRTPTESVSEPGALQIRRLQAELAQLTLDNIDEAVDPTLELNVKRAELAVERVKQAILEGQIVAPFAGEIRFINLPINDEQIAAPAYSAVARLVDTTQFRIELNLPREQLETLTEGMQVSISAASLGAQRLPGIIEALPRPFGTSQGSLTEVAINNTGDNTQLREGITVGVNVRLKSKPNALVLPVTALQRDGDLYHVLVQRGTATERAEVAVGVINNDLAEIIRGVGEGDVVVVKTDVK
jgi:multidrug efflux pump subunit AcrA (membrane-fusion protein)